MMDGSQWKHPGYGQTSSYVTGKNIYPMIEYPMTRVKKKKENQGNDGKYLSIYGVSFFFIIHDKTSTPSKPSTI